MRKIASLGGAAVLLAIVVTPAAADGFPGWRKAPPRAWRIGAISANVITPDYFR